MPTHLKQSLWFLAPPILLSLVLGLWGIGEPGLWYDERVTAETTEFGPFIYPWDIAIVPFYIVAWVWTLGGEFNGDIWLRSLSVVGTLISVTSVSLAARRVAGNRAGLSAGLILALMPGVARYSQEGRVYALAIGLAAASMWFLVEFIHGGKRRWIVAYAGVLFF